MHEAQTLLQSLSFPLRLAMVFVIAYRFLAWRWHLTLTTILFHLWWWEMRRLMTYTEP